MISRLLRRRRGNVNTKKDVEDHFLKLYSMWHETHDLSLRKRLLVRLNKVMRRVPDYDIRRRFEQAF